MKIWIIIFCVSGILGSCNIRSHIEATDARALNKQEHFQDTTTVQMIDSVFDFGKITDGEKVTYNYRFRNTGDKALIISSATASCGCTVPEKPEEPINPGETGSLKVVFNSEGRVGPTNKAVTVISNAYPAFPVLQLKGEVISKNK
ncbi:MAG: DUF1573 domain-containing protein [Ginsengibacter sp.]